MDGPDVEALRAVDRFIKAFNAGNRDAVITSFTAHATVSYFNSLVDLQSIPAGSEACT